MAKVLELKFDTTNGKSLTLSIDQPKQGVTSSEIENAMSTIISANIFHVSGSSLESINQARIVERTVSEIEFM